MLRAGPLVVVGWTGDELNVRVPSSIESVRRNELVTWFRQELHAESFFCAYWSSSTELSIIPANAFGRDDSKTLFELDLESETDLSAEFLPSSPDELGILRGRGMLTWADGLTLSYQIEAAVGQEIFVSIEGFEKALMELQDGKNGRNKSSSQGRNGTKAVSPAKLKEWYLERVKNWLPSEPFPTEELDLAAAKVVFPLIGRDSLRVVRREHAPEAWLKQGRRGTML